MRGVLGNRHPYRDRLLAYVTGLVKQTHFGPSVGAAADRCVGKEVLHLRIW